jgi:hypothetical protein
MTNETADSADKMFSYKRKKIFFSVTFAKMFYVKVYQTTY